MWFAGACADTFGDVCYVLDFDLEAAANSTGIALDFCEGGKQRNTTERTCRGVSWLLFSGGVELLGSLMVWIVVDMGARLETGRVAGGALDKVVVCDVTTCHDRL